MKANQIVLQSLYILEVHFRICLSLVKIYFMFHVIMSSCPVICQLKPQICRTDV